MSTFVGCSNKTKSCIPTCEVADVNQQLVGDPAQMGVVPAFDVFLASRGGILSPSQIYLPAQQAAAVTRAQLGQPSTVMMEGTTGVDRVASLRSVGNPYGTAIVTNNPSAISNCCLPSTVMSVSTETFGTQGKQTSTGYEVNVGTAPNTVDRRATWFAANPQKPNVTANILASPVVGVHLN